MNLQLPARVSAVVFDCDGLLLDTETCWSRAEACLFADHGFDFGPIEKDLLIGRSLEAACADMAAYFGKPGRGPDLAIDLIHRVERELAAGVKLMPGAAELIELLVGRVPLGIATNSPRRLLTAALDRTDLSDYFQASIAADEVTRPKPGPELYLRAFAMLGADPEAGVALEDSSTGVKSARAAHTFLITVPSQPGKDLDGDYVCASLADPAVIDWARTVTP